MTTRADGGRPRLWPAYAIVALLLAAWTWIWLIAETSRGRQYRVLPTMASGIFAGVLLFVWWVGFSRLPRRLRLAGAGLVVAAAMVAGSTLRIRGLTGDWVPIVEYRWASRPTLASVPDAPPGPASPPSTPSVPSPPTTRESPPAAVSPVAAKTAVVHRHPGDFPQFLGPGRDATLHGVRLARNWSSTAPRRLWRQPIGEGWSGFAVSGDLAITQEQRGADERVVAYDLMTGRPRWGHTDRVRYQTFQAGVGPRATPTIADGRVFAMGATGILNALDLATGRLLWSHDVVEENGAQLPDWGKSCSPLVLGRRVIVSAGGSNGRSLVAYDVATGDLIWSGGTDRASYSSPVIVELAGRSQIVILNDRTIAGHDPDTGALLWEHPWPPGSPSATAPVPIAGDRLLASAGYGVGAKAIRVASGPTVHFTHSSIGKTCASNPSSPTSSSTTGTSTAWTMGC